VRRTGVDRSQHSPPRIKPHLGQVSENSSKPPRSKHWRVFHERESGSYLANDPGKLCPQPTAFAVEPCAFSGATNVLAGKSAADNVNASAPRFTVEGSHVVPDWERGEASVALSGEQDASRVGINLDSADGAPSEEHASENASSSASE
jgi:hypothetical protein